MWGGVMRGDGVRIEGWREERQGWDRGGGARDTTARSNCCGGGRSAERGSVNGVVCCCRAEAVVQQPAGKEIQRLTIDSAFHPSPSLDLCSPPRDGPHQPHRMTQHQHR